MKKIQPHLKRTTYKIPLLQTACRLSNSKDTLHANDPPFPFPPSNETEVRSRGGWSLGCHPSHRQTGFSVTDTHAQVLSDSARQSQDCYTKEFCIHATNSFEFCCVAKTNMLKHLRYKLALKSGCLMLERIS